MSAVAQSVSTLTNTIQKSSFATVEEKVAGFKAIGLALWILTKYTTLGKGFSECWRCLRAGGTLIFKWNEDQIPVSEVLKLAPAKPLLGNRSSQKTHWIVFYKGN